MLVNSSQSVLACVNISKSYGKTVANDGISCSLPPNTVTGLLGPNGSGKSTIVKIICGILSQDEGSVYIERIKCKKGVPNSEIGVIFEEGNSAYGYLTTIDNFKYFALLNNVPSNEIDRKIAFTLDFWGLEHIKNEYYYHLSTGLKQKVLIALATMKDPQILILDEPTLGLDLIACLNLKKQLLDFAAMQKKTILVASHDFNFINDICSHIILLSKGKLKFQGSIEDFKALGNCGVPYEILIKNDPEIKRKLKSNRISYFEHENTLRLKVQDLNVLKSILEQCQLLEIKKNGGITSSFIEAVNEQCS